MYARNPLGPELVAWATVVHEPGEPVTRFRASDGRVFGPVEDAPAPPRLSAGDDHIDTESRHFSELVAAIAPDGTVALGTCETDYRSDTRTALLWVRRPGQSGSWTRADDDCRGTVRLGADALGRIEALWSAVAPGANPNSPRLIWTASLPAGAAEFGSPRAISDPSKDADNGFSPPDLFVAPTGEALATWNGPPTAMAGAAPPGTVHAAVRSRDGRWAMPYQLSGQTAFASRPSAAASAWGEMVVVWNDANAVASATRLPGAQFGHVFSTTPGPAENEKLPVALDAFGNVVVIRRWQDHLQAFIRARDGQTSAEIAISPTGFNASRAAVVTDPFGNGLVVWSQTDKPTGAHPEAKVVAYSAQPPDLGVVKVLPSGRVTLDVNEPARVALTVRAGRRTAKQVFKVLPHAGREKLRPTVRVAALLRARGTRRLTLQARDAGPRYAIVRKVLRGKRHSRRR